MPPAIIDLNELERRVEVLEREIGEEHLRAREIPQILYNFPRLRPMDMHFLERPNTEQVNATRRIRVGLTRRRVPFVREGRFGLVRGQWPYVVPNGDRLSALSHILMNKQIIRQRLEDEDRQLEFIQIGVSNVLINY